MSGILTQEHDYDEPPRTLARPWSLLAKRILLSQRACLLWAVRRVAAFLSVLPAVFHDQNGLLAARLRVSPDSLRVPTLAVPTLLRRHTFELSEFSRSVENRTSDLAAGFLLASGGRRPRHVCIPAAGLQCGLPRQMLAPTTGLRCLGLLHSTR